MSSNKKKFLLEGKTKKIYTTDNKNEIIIHYKNNITALNGLKNKSIQDKGMINNAITTLIFKFLNSCKVPTHFIRKINPIEQLCYKVNMFPLEFIVRNIVYGSMSKRLGIKEGIIINHPIFEIFYKNDALNDPLINNHHAVFLDIISYKELNIIHNISSNVNTLLKEYFLNKNIILVDFKIEFGKYKNNKILLSDEISPDTCRLWDKKTMKKLDKDIFRKNGDDIMDIYMEVLKRIG
ncbi:phosphoribosylaminoimidazolesuccinocarboxamide synthase [Blattabacterium cuenoti]|uniref:phosphoribosylaminoimidazolesuccinocarboxamide synthase n=1 Tax=Blattabacterium cuenoti TaxID=1653831 RepID=UPI00163C57FA|nr:phosphoribosylaminoimidazolesuccinocarboxamide synthase [Blattabacterium cuenoti]